MADIEKVENWRLSRIEDELEKLDFTQDFLDHSFSDSIFNSLPLEIGHSLKLTAAKTENEEQRADEGFSEDEDMPLPPPPEDLLYPGEIETGTQSELKDPGPELSQLTRVCVQEERESGIYSEANVKPVIKQVPQEADAVKKITDKYDSLKRLTLPSLPKFIPPGYVKAKPTSVIITQNHSGDLNTNGQLKKVPNTPTKMTDPFLDCLSTSTPHKQKTQQPQQLQHQQHQQHQQHPQQLQQPPASPPPPPPQMSHNTSWSDMDKMGPPGRLLGAATQDTDSQLSQGPPNNHSIKRMSFVSSLTETEILQVEMFYRSHKSDVFVCTCAADLFFGSVSDASNSPSSDPTSSGWTSVMSGVPVIILETEDRHGNKKLSMVIAEKGTGFCMWKESFTHFTNYQARQPNFHTLHLDADHTKLAGIRFQDTSGASLFQQRLQAILGNPELSIVNVNAKSKKTKNSKGGNGGSKGSKLKRRPTSKGDISAPCCFTHITSLDRSEGMGVIQMTGENSNENSTNTSVVHSWQKVK